ncbi:MAG: S26 family signal peptidase [Treponema sp.]|nr:S26 family signal peptidase [Treponema sp.]
MGKLGKCAVGRVAIGKSPVGKIAVGNAILGAFLAALLMKFFILDIMIADGQSMAPAIKPGKVLFVCKVFYGIRMPISGTYIIQWKQPRSGDVLVFYTPLGEIAVKRIAEILPDNTFNALGDNSPYSYDSRNYGLVPLSNIIGRVLWVR